MFIFAQQLRKQSRPYIWGVHIYKSPLKLVGFFLMLCNLSQIDFIALVVYFHLIGIIISVRGIVAPNRVCFIVLYNAFPPLYGLLLWNFFFAHEYFNNLYALFILLIPIPPPYLGKKSWDRNSSNSFSTRV